MRARFTLNANASSDINGAGKSFVSTGFLEGASVSFAGVVVGAGEENVVDRTVAGCEVRGRELSFSSVVLPTTGLGILFFNDRTGGKEAVLTTINLFVASGLSVALVERGEDISAGRTRPGGGVKVNIIRVIRVFG